jgi:hypothetical protein
LAFMRIFRPTQFREIVQSGNSCCTHLLPPNRCRRALPYWKWSMGKAGKRECTP